MLTLTLVIAICLAVGAVMGLAPGRASDQPPTVQTVTRTLASSYRSITAAQWAHRYKVRTRQYQKARKALRLSMRYPVYGLSSDERAFMCIHGFEGSWTDSGAPFYGGLQMDRSFMSTYGGWALKAFGTADHWPISVQLAVAIQAKVSGRGFYPWPNTARYCGLIS